MTGFPSVSAFCGRAQVLRYRVITGDEKASSSSLPPPVMTEIPLAGVYGFLVSL